MGGTLLEAAAAAPAATKPNFVILFADVTSSVCINLNTQCHALRSKPPTGFGFLLAGAGLGLG